MRPLVYAAAMSTRTLLGQTRRLGQGSFNLCPAAKTGRQRPNFVSRGSSSLRDGTVWILIDYGMAVKLRPVLRPNSRHLGQEQMRVGSSVRPSWPHWLQMKLPSRCLVMGRNSLPRTQYGQRTSFSVTSFCLASRGNLTNLGIGSEVSDVMAVTRETGLGAPVGSAAEPQPPIFGIH